MRNKEFSDRRGDASSAKAAQLTAFMAAQSAGAAERAAKAAERAAVAQARDERRAARDQVKRDELAKAAEAAAVKAAEALALQQEIDLAAAEAAAAVPSMDSHIARIIADGAARKAERDMRYAKRKAASRHGA